MNEDSMSFFTLILITLFIFSVIMNITLFYVIKLQDFEKKLLEMEIIRLRYYE